MTILLVGVFALPAGATVHEITGMECSGGNAMSTPPGLTGGSNAANFAKPLLATGVLQMPGFVWVDHPASKVQAGEGLPPVFDYTLPYANCKALRDL